MKGIVILVKTYTELAQELYAAFAQGDVEKMLNHLDENVTWETSSQFTSFSTRAGSYLV